MGFAEVPRRGRSALPRQCAGVANTAQHGAAAVARNHNRIGRVHAAARRNMNKNVLASARGLDKSKTLGRVKPLHSTFSHRVVSAGSKIENELLVPANRHVRRAHDTRYEARLIAQTTSRFWRKTINITAHLRLLPVSRSFEATNDRKTRLVPTSIATTAPTFPVGRIASARDSALNRILVGRGEVIDDLADIGIVDRRTVDLDHLGDFRLPEVLPEFLPARLGVDVIGGWTGGAIVLHHFQIWSRFESSGLVRKREGDRPRMRRTGTHGCGGEERKEEKLQACHDCAPHAAVTRTVSTTLRRYPGGFHLGSFGCVSPALLVARTLSS